MNTTSINLLPFISMNRDGQLVNDSEEPIHLRQGDMDGACGPYCVVMALLARNTVKRQDFSPLNKIDYRTRAGRLLNEIRQTDPLVLSGMAAEQLQQLFIAHNSACSKLTYGSSKELLATASKSIKAGHPVIIGIKGRKQDNLDHWTLVIGTCSNNLYLLDPGYDLPTGNYWNAIISTNPTSNRFGYRYINPWNSTDIEINSLIEVN